MRLLYRLQHFLAGCYGIDLERARPRILGLSTFGSYRIFKIDDPYATVCVHDVSLKEPCPDCLRIRGMVRHLP